MISFSPVLEFYITNVCNLTCRGCNRFNNYNFKGHQRWADHADVIEAWSKRITADKLSIIGGEPTLNPDLELWISNLRRLWPTVRIIVQTNGTYILPKFAMLSEKYQVTFVVSLHDVETSAKIIDEWKNLIGPSFKPFLPGFVFHQAAVINKGDYFEVHNNNTQDAFSCCDMKHDHTIFNGKLFKCPSMALLPEFKNQFDLRLSEHQQQLLSSFQPLSADCTDEQLQEFASTRDTPISQCTFCPTNPSWGTACGPEKQNLPTPDFDNYVTKINLFDYKKRLT